MNFEDIRPYHDEEVQQKVKNLVDEPQFQQVIEHVYNEVNYLEFKEKMLQVQTVKQFQQFIVVPLLNKLLKKSTNGLSFEGIENLEKGKAYLFVSTHRDIVLDSALMNYVLLEQGFETAEIAIGDNLMKIPWVVDLVKLNKSFIVKRNLPKEEKVQGSIQLSSYINHTIKNKGESIWIAQRSGRSKDGNDATNPSLLKMFNLANGEMPALEGIKSLNICPVSIAYEYNPCDVLTLPEQMIVAKGEKYEKQPMEDMMHMGQGIEGEKGRVKVSFGQPLNALLDELEGVKNRNQLLASVAKIIDNEIHHSYHLMPTNYIAYDILNKTEQFKEEYTTAEKQGFKTYMESRLKEIAGDEQLKHDTFLMMYANPVSNSLVKTT